MKLIHWIFKIFVHIIHPAIGTVYSFIRFFVPKSFKGRFIFEQLNSADPYSKSFTLDNIKAKACFHVSSEGEFEQVHVLIESYLDQQEKVEIIYSSGSLELKLSRFKSRWGIENVRLLRLPLLTVTIWEPDLLRNWVSAKKIYFCRYDFYPHILDLANDRISILLSAALKNKMSSIKHNPFAMFIYKYIYSRFAHIVASNEIEKKNLFNLGIADWKIHVFDYRIPSILKRLDSSRETIIEKSNLTGYINALEQYEGRKIIIGSAWEEDIEIISNTQFISELKNQSAHLCIAPHVHTGEVLNQIKKVIEQAGLGLKVISPEQDYDIDLNEGQVVLLLHRGILCELYSFFNFALVGCGFKKSVHSVLEPYLAGCCVSCGPRVHRSTEVDWIKSIEPTAISILSKPEGFYEHYSNCKRSHINYEDHLKHDQLTHFLVDFKERCI